MKQTALLVGVNRYDDDAIVNLAYAEQDARELYAFLKRTALYDEVRHLPASEADEDRILNAAARLIEPLEPGDLFLFFFAGHGVQFRGRHLLLCPQVRFHRLEFGHHTVPVDLLKQETARSGVSRVFVLDACRGNLLATREGPAQGFRGAAGLRDIVCAPAPKEGPLSILCSCDEGRQAQELPRLEQGLFSRALLEEFERAAGEGGELKLDDRLELSLRERMCRLARDHELPLLDQRPWIQRSGEVPALLHGRRKETPAPELSPLRAIPPSLPPLLPGRGKPQVEPNGPERRLQPPAEPARLARVTVRSERRWLEQEAVYSVLVDGVEAGRMGNGGVGSFDVNPGRHTLVVGYSCHPRAWRRYRHRRPLDLSTEPLDLDLSPGLERVVDCDVNELSWLLSIPGLHVIMMLLIEFTPCRWLRLRLTAAALPVPARAPAQAPSGISMTINKQTPVSVPAPPPTVLPPLPQVQAPPPPVRALKSHRGGTIFALGILGFFTFGLAGISAWVEGNKDLKEMRYRTMDPSGWHLTAKGRKLGIIATIVWAVIILGKLKLHPAFWHLLH